MVSGKTVLTIILGLCICSQMQAQDFALPRPPREMVSISQRAGFVVEHYWDNADLADLAGNGSPELEQAFVNYLSVFPLTQSDSLCTANAARLMFRADSLGGTSVATILNLAEKYLFSPDSPMIQEEYFRGFAEAAVSCRNISGEQRLRLPFWSMAMDNNRKGHAIEHFRFETSDGALMDFHDLEGKRLLILYDPDCQDCNKLIDEFIAKDLDCLIVAIALNCTRERFLSRARSLPSNWIRGWDSERMINGGAFMIRHFPDLFLVDASGLILAKHRIEF